MAFRLTTSKTFKAKVTVPVANDKGDYDYSDFMAIFSHADTKELDELRKLTNHELICGKDLEDGKRQAGKLVGWEMTDAETKTEVPFTPEMVELVMRIPPSPQRIAMAFWETVNGARAKNS